MLRFKFLILYSIEFTHFKSTNNLFYIMQTPLRDHILKQLNYIIFQKHNVFTHILAKRLLYQTTFSFFTAHEQCHTSFL